MDNSLIKALRSVIREEVINRNIVEIEGLGQFSVRHQNQYQKKSEDGELVMMPPRDQIVFTPKKQNSSP